MTYTVGGSATSARYTADSGLAASPQLFVSRVTPAAPASAITSQQSPAAVTGATKYGATAAAAAHVTDELRAQNRYLERRVDYLQSVSSVFRQKMAVMLRDCVRSASSMSPVDLQRLYAKAIEEIARAERDMMNGGGDGGEADEEAQQQRLFGGEDAVDEVAAAGRTPTAASAALQRVRRTADAKEDVRKAHLICVALQEKNDLKEKLIAVNRELADVRERFEDLTERHRRLVTIQTAAAPPGSAVASIKDLYEERIRELEDTVLQLKSDNVKLRIGGCGGTGAVGGGKATSAAAGSPQGTASKGESDLPPLDGDVPADDVEKLVKQNQQLKARVHRMKEEQAALKQQSITSTEQLQHGLDLLLARIADLQRQLDDKDVLIHQLTNEKRELAKECVAHRGQVDMYVKQLELFVKDSDIAQLSHARKANATRGEAENLSSAVDEYLQQIHQKDEVIQNLMNQLREEKRKHQERVLETRALGVQLETFRAKLDALQAQQHQREQQEQLLSGIEHRLLSAVHDIHQTQNTSALSGKLDQLSQKLKLMEHVDLQLRQKEDELVLLKDELEQTREEKEELLATLTSISQMFIRFPKTVGEVERMMVQLEEVQRELALCAQQHATPDPLRVEGKVELRMLELQGRSKGRSKGTPQRRSGSAASAAAGSASEGEKKKTRSEVGATGPDDARLEANSRLSPLDDDDVWEQQLEAQLAELMNIPPLPPLDSLQLPPREEQPIVATAATLSAVSPQRSGAQTAAQAGLGFTSPSGGPGSVHDVHLTFQLFDDEGAGVLSSDMIRLCLATLGITRALPATVTHMTEDQFLAFCCGHDADA